MRTWDYEEIFHQGDAYFDSLCQALRQAEQSIEFETYIFELGTLGRRILTELAAAAERGVRVRLLIDGFGSPAWVADQVAQTEALGIEVRIYHPFPWQLSSFHFGRWWRLGTWSRRMGLANRRNHRKSCVIDGRIGFLGGMNVSDWHLESVQGARAWRDSAVQVRGPALARLAEAYEIAWISYRGLTQWFSPQRQDDYSRSSASLIRLNDSRRQRFLMHRDLVRRIFRAKTRVWITTPYLAPDRRLLHALRYAAARGIDVRLLVPRKNDIWMMHWVGRAFYRLLLSHQVRIYEYRPRTLHAKIFLIDQWGTVGSSNLNHRSFHHDLEVDAVLTQASSIDNLHAQFQMDVDLADEILPWQWHRRGWWARLLEKIAIKFKPWV